MVLQILNIQSLEYLRILHDLTLCYKILMDYCDTTVSSSLLFAVIISRGASYINSIVQLVLLNIISPTRLLMNGTRAQLPCYCSFRILISSQGIAVAVVAYCYGVSVLQFY